MSATDEIRRILDYAIRQKSRNFAELDTSVLERGYEYRRSPRWPSGTWEIDQLTDGGFYGLCALAGKKKLGKTIIAVSSSLHAARSGWSVHYAYGENTQDIMLDLQARWLGPDRCEELPPWHVECWRGFRFYRGHQIEHLLQSVSDNLLPGQDRVLVIIDSVNRLARRSPSRFLEALARIVDVCQTAAEESRGHIGFMLLSELNQHGGMTGLDVEHAAGCLVWLRRTKHPRRVKVTIDSRESESGELGELYRDYEHCRFVKESTIVEETERQRLIREGELILFPMTGQDQNPEETQLSLVAHDPLDDFPL